MYNPDVIEASKDELRDAVLSACPFKPLYVKLKVFFGNTPSRLCANQSCSSYSALLIVGGVRVGGDRKVFDEVESSIPNSRIIITGYVSNNDLPSYYSLMDVFVHPSMRDGMPNALLEAMTCEKAVIATSVGGIPDVVMDCDNGILVPANDAGALSNAISHLFENELLRRKLGVQPARQLWLDLLHNWNWRKISKSIVHWD